MNHIDNVETSTITNIPLSEEQLQLLYTEFTRKFRLEEQSRLERGEHSLLPQEIYEEMEQSSKTELHNNLKKYARDVQQYDGGDWTTAETINKGFISELKKYNVDTHQVVSYKYKDADRLRTAARGATEIFEELKFIADRGGDPSDEEAVVRCIEKLRRLAIFGFATAKKIDQEARSLAAKALRLPDTVKHLDEEEESDKRLAFSPEVVEKINHARYEAAIIKGATSSFRVRQYGSGRDTRRGRPFGYSKSFRGRSFFGKGQPSRGAGPTDKPNNIHNSSNNPDNQ